MRYVFSGSAILSVSPADDDAIVLEVAEKKQNKEDKKIMEFTIEDMKTAIHSTISELMISHRLMNHRLQN